MSKDLLSANAVMIERYIHYKEGEQYFLIFNFRFGYCFLQFLFFRSTVMINESNFLKSRSVILEMFFEDATDFVYGAITFEVIIFIMIFLFAVFANGFNILSWKRSGKRLWTNRFNCLGF